MIVEGPVVIIVGFIVMVDGLTVPYCVGLLRLITTLCRDGALGHATPLLYPGQLQLTK